MIPVLLLASVLNAPDLSPVAMERACDEPKVRIVAEGRAQLPVIVADGRREREAAFYLAATIRDITGVRPDIYVETPTRPVGISPALRIARSDDTDTFRVITKDGTVWFLGRSDFAVYDWCERVLGVRDYFSDPKMPGRTFPHSRDLAVEAVDYADWPVFGYRDRPAARGVRRANVLKLGGTHRGGVNVHAPHRWFADPDVRTNHPNVFARQPDGSRGELPLLCYGSPETLAYYKRRIDEHIAGIRDSGGIVDTNRHVITVSHWDTLLECTCPHCQELFDPSLGMTGSGSPIIWGWFLKDLAKWAKAAHPDYTISFLPYLNVCDVPAGLDLTEEGNCEAMLCSMSGLAMFKDPRVRDREESLIRDWARVTGRKVLNWHYSCWPLEFTSAPYLFGQTIVDHYQRMAPYEIGSFICGGGSRMVSERLALYVWHKCLWNPSLDVDAVYDVFARRMFGPAAKPMRRLMAIQEDGWARLWERPRCCLRNTFDISYPPEDIAEMRRLLSEAAALAEGNVFATARVRWYAADFIKFFADEARYRGGPAFRPLEVVHADVAPVLDGRFDDACWKIVEPREFVPAFDPDKRLRRKTTVRAAWTEKGVFLAIRCEEPAMADLNRSAAYGELREQDTLEIFFDASGTTTGTCHRLMFDVRHRTSATADVVWRAEGITSTMRCFANAWQLEVFIPFTSPSGVVSRTRWYGNLVRWHPGDGDERERSRLSTLGSKWNQDRDAFSEWRFVTPDNH